MKKRYPQEMLLMFDCPNCGQEVNRDYVRKIIDEILEKAINENAKIKKCKNCGEECVLTDNDLCSECEIIYFGRYKKD